MLTYTFLYIFYSLWTLPVHRRLIYRYLINILIIFKEPYLLHKEREKEIDRQRTNLLTYGKSVTKIISRKGTQVKLPKSHFTNFHAPCFCFVDNVHYNILEYFRQIWELIVNISLSNAFFSKSLF